MFTQDKVLKIYEELKNNLKEMNEESDLDDLCCCITIRQLEAQIDILHHILELDKNKRYKFSDELPLSLAIDFVNLVNNTLDVLHPNQRPIQKLTFGNIKDFTFRIFKNESIEVFKGYQVKGKKFLPYVIEVK